MPEYQLTMFRCEWCKKALADTANGRKMRTDKKYCSKSCRAMHSNWVKRSDKLVVSICKDLHELGVYLDDRQTEDSAITQFGTVLKAFRFETLNRGVQIKAVERE